MSASARAGVAKWRWRVVEMRSGGFPCRLAGCDRAFQVMDQNSLDALKAASSERTAHEIAAHGYHHIRLDDERAYMPHARIKPPKSEVAR
jgi:hypothetical protein